MAFEKEIVADTVVQRLIESKGIFKFCNRSFDSLARPGASSIRVPKLAVPVVRTTGTPLNDADRKKAKDDTNMVDISLGQFIVPLANELLAQFESNAFLIQEYLNSASLVLQAKIDQVVLAEAADNADDIDDFESATLDWVDIINIMSVLSDNEVPEEGRIIAIPPALAPEFFDIDVVKGAVQYNPSYLETGSFINFMGMKFFISAKVPKVSEKDCIVGFHGPSLAVVINRLGEIKEAWDTINAQDVVDMVAH
ncbi:MAG: hypothetical protein FJ216_10115, partial [Ignavibacteria bacterium]|nr:hypothetical protein [Ignavibacteria bacterium]